MVNAASQAGDAEYQAPGRASCVDEFMNNNSAGGFTVT